MRHSGTAALLLFVLIAIQPLARALPPLLVVALTGNHAPGMPDGTAFADLRGRPALNAKGQVAFRATWSLDPFGRAANLGIWSDGSGTLALVARTGAPLPGFSEELLCTNISLPLLSDGGELTFAGTIGRTNYMGIWRGNSETLSTIAAEGMHPPGTDINVVYGSVYAPLVSSSGIVAHSGSTVDGSSGDSTYLFSGLWVQHDGRAELLARSGDPAVGFDGSGYGGFGVAGINAAGEIAFSSRTNGTTVANGLWLHDGDSAHLIVRTESQVPGLPAGQYFSDISGVSLSDSGEVVFDATLLGPEFTSVKEGGIWVGAQGSLRLVVQQGTAVPESPEGTTFEQVDYPVINGRGTVAFRGSFTGVDSSRNRGIWRSIDGEIREVVREGGQVPGVPDGVVFGNFNSSGVNEYKPDLTINSLGQIAFYTTVNGNGINGSNDRGIWAEDIDGLLKLIVREGDALEVLPGDFRIVQTVYFVGGGNTEDGHLTGFNDRGQLAFSASFTDGTSGIFVSNLVAVPEPTVMAFVFSAILFCFRRRR